MPATNVVFYQDDQGIAPAYEGIEALDLEQPPMARKKTTSNALQILDDLVGEDDNLRDIIEQEQVHAAVARDLHTLRTSRGLTQQQLAERVGTTQSVIARLEDADYRGHSLRMLRRVARALGARLDVHLEPREAVKGGRRG